MIYLVIGGHCDRMLRILMKYGLFRKWSKYQLFRKFILCLMVIAFTVEALSALRRMKKERSAVSYTITDQGNILFPSISFCKMLPFGEYSVPEFRNSTTSLEAVKEVFEQKLLRKSQVLHFVTHGDSLNLSFPCMTVGTGDVVGIPCAFPFVYRDCRLHYDPQEYLIKIYHLGKL